MALDPLTNLLFSALELIKGSFLLSIPVFLLAWIGAWVQQKLTNRLHFSWVISAWGTLFILTLLLVTGVYYLPLLSLAGASPLGVIPSEFQDTFYEVMLQHVLNFVRLLVVSLILSLILMPLAFIGSFLRASLSHRFKWPAWGILYATIFLLTLLVSIGILFLIPWILPGIWSLIFYGLQG